MPHLFNHQQFETDDSIQSVIDTYADAMLRTFASLKPPSSITLTTTSEKYNSSDPTLRKFDNDSLDSQSIHSDTSSLLSTDENQSIFDLSSLSIKSSIEPIEKFQELISSFDKINYNKTSEMSTKTLLPSPSHINDRYFFRSNSTMKKKSKTKLDTTSPSLRKRYKFPSANNDQYRNKNIYKFPTNHIEPRSHSIDSTRYYFPLDNTMVTSRKTVPYGRTGSALEPRSVTFMEGTSTMICDTPYLFSKTTDTIQYPSTKSTHIGSENPSFYRNQSSKRSKDIHVDSSSHSISLGSEFQKSKRLDTVTSTNGSLSKLKRLRSDKTPCVHFESPSYLNEAREILSGRRRNQSPESFERSVDRLISSVNKKYGQQSTTTCSSTPTPFNYISQYYIQEDKPFSDDSLEIDNEQKRFYSSLNTNRTHTQIMKNLNKSLIDRNYQLNKNRLKYLQQNVRRYLRSYENQSLQRELNYDLIRCFSSSYLEDLKLETNRHIHTRDHMRSYTYEDIQDMHIPSMLEAYKMKINVDKEKQLRLQLSITTGQLSPVSSSAYSPVMLASFNENLETQSTGFETDRKSHTSTSQPVTTIRPNVDLFYEIMQESFVGIDASIAGHVARATECKREKYHPYPKNIRNTDTDIDIQTFSSLWSDEDELTQLSSHTNKSNQKKINSHHRKLSRYLSTVNRSLLDRPGDLIADFYLSQLNRNMQDSVRHIEIIAQDKAHRQGFMFNRNKILERSLSAEHLYQVRKEHIRYKQSFKTPTSFTAEDVSDIYKPFVLENYKRKIAIELERRRRARQEQLRIDISSSPLLNSEIDLNANAVKSTHPPIIDYDDQTRPHHDFLIVSPSNVVQTKEVIMGRARRTIMNDGSSDVIHHVGIISPPQVYSILIPSTSRTNTTYTGTMNHLYEVPTLTTIDPPDLIDRKTKYKLEQQQQQQQHRNDGFINNTLTTSQQIISSDPPIINASRPKTKIYTNLTHSNMHKICHAKYLPSESIDKKLSTITVQPMVTLNQDGYHHARPAIAIEQPTSITDQCDVEEYVQYVVEEKNVERTKLKIPMDEYIAVVQQETPILENLSTKNRTVLPNTDSSMIQRQEQPFRLNTLCTNKFNSSSQHHLIIDDVLLNEEVQDMTEPLPEYGQVNIRNEVSYANTCLQPLVIQLVYNFDPLASFFEQSTTTTNAHIQNAKQIIVDNYELNSYENFEDNIRIPIVVNEPEWIDENIQIFSDDFHSNIENAQCKRPDIIQYECVKINLPKQYIHKSFQNNSLEYEHQFDQQEQLLTLTNDSYLMNHQEQAHIHKNEYSCLENLIKSSSILPLNYPYYTYKQFKKNFLQNEISFTNEEELSIVSSNPIEKYSIDSQISSFLDMETFLNNFEDSLDYEQHLPIIDQMSRSYVISKTERNDENNRSLPIEWFKPTIIQTHDEQLVEQWIVEKDTDTIQHEGTQRREQIHLIVNTTNCVNLLHNTSTNNISSINKKLDENKISNHTGSIDIPENNDIFTHCSPTSDYETDTIDKDNETALSTINNAFLIPVTSTKNILPSSSITNTTLSLSPLTLYSAPTNLPIIYFLDALAAEQNQINNPTRNFLLTIGFGHNEIHNTMNEITNTVSTFDQPIRPTWINRSSDFIHILPTIIHHENDTQLPSIQQEIHFAIENQLEADDIAHLIHPHRLQFGYNLCENIQGPLSIVFESSHMHLATIHEMYIYEMSVHNVYSLFHPPDILPHILPFKTQDNELFLPDDYEIKQPELLSFVESHGLYDNEEDLQAISCKFNRPTYIDHYHIQSLFPFPETCYADIFQPDVFIKSEHNLLSSIFSKKISKNKEEPDSRQLDQRILMQEKLGSKQKDHEYSQLKFPTTTASIDVRPPISGNSGPIYEDVSMKKTVDVDMGTEGQYKQDATYKYGSQTDLSTKYETNQTILPIVRPPVLPATIDIPTPTETIVEHISEDEKSTSSEEAFFEEWSEEFPCRRTEEYDQNTNQLIRYDIIETGERIKSDILKEEYKGKNVRVKRHKSYDVVKQITQNSSKTKTVPIRQLETYVHEEISQPPPSLPIQTTTSSLSTQDQQWTSEDIYTTEVVCDANFAREIEARVNQFDSITPVPSSSSSSTTTAATTKTYDHVRPGGFTTIPSSTQANVSITPSSSYEQMTTVVTPTVNYADKRKQEPEEFISEEYEVEVQTTKHPETSEEDTMDTNTTTNQTSTGRRSSSDWRSRLRQIYAPTSDDDRFDQYNKYNNGYHTAQRAAVIPSYNRQNLNEIQLPTSGSNRTSYQSNRLDSSPPSRHVVKEILVTVSRSSSSERKPYYSSSNDYEQKKRKVYFADSETQEKIMSSSSMDDDDRRRSPKHSSSTIVDEHPIDYQQYINTSDRPSFGRVDQIKNTFESAKTNYAKDERTTKYPTTITTGLTEQRRKAFEEREQTNADWARRSINEFPSNERRMSETHTAPSLVSNRISQIDSLEIKSTPTRIQSNDRLNRTEYETITQSRTPTVIDIQIKSKQETSPPIETDLNRLSQPIYQTTKSIKQKDIEDAGHESEDELSDPKQNYDARRRIVKARLRDFSQSTSQPIDTNLTVQRTATKFNERNMENILSHVPTSKGKGILVELSSDLCSSPTRSPQDLNKSNLTNDSGIYEYSTTISQQLPTSSPTWRHNVSTSMTDDGNRTYDHGAYIDSTSTSTSSPYNRRQTSDVEQTITQNTDDSSIVRSTSKYNTDISSNEPVHIHHQHRTVRRQLRSSTPDEYENLSNYQSGIDIQNKIPITTQSRSRKPLVVDEIETIETETHVECQVQRTNEIKESTKTERTTSPRSSSQKQMPTTLTRSIYNSSDETTPIKRIVANERPQYYDRITTTDASIPIEIQETCFKPIERYRSQENLRQSPLLNTTDRMRSIEVTSLSPRDQITFGKNSPNEIVAIVRVPELKNDLNRQTNTLRHVISEPQLNEKVKQDQGRSRLHYQRVHAASYIPPSINENLYSQPLTNRSRIGPVGIKHDYSSPLNFSPRSASYHSSFHRQTQPQQQQQQQQQQSHSPTSSSSLNYNPQTRFHSGSLGNLLGSNVDFEIEIEKRPPHQPEQPTIISLDQSSRAIVTTSKDGRVSIQNLVARPGNTVTINSDFHASDRSLNRSSGYFSSDEFRSQNMNTNYSSDEQLNNPNITYSSTIHPTPSYNFDQVNRILRNYSQSPNKRTNEQTYKFSKPISMKNRRKELSKNSNEYGTRYTSTGFQHLPHEQQQSTSDMNDNTQNWSSLPAANVSMTKPNSNYTTTQNMIVHQNRLNDQSQIVQRNRTSIKQMKQKNAARKRNVLMQGHQSDEDDNYDSPLSDHSNLEQRSQISTGVYNFNNYHQ